MGSVDKLLRSTFRFVNLVKLPKEIGNSIKKFSVKISSCKFSHLKI